MLKAEKHPPKQHVSLGGELCFNPKSMSSRFVSMAITPSMADRFAHQFHYVPLFSTLTQRHPVRPSHPGIRSSSAKMSGLKRLLVPQLSCFRRHFCNGSQIIGHDSKSYIHLFNSLHGTGIYTCICMSVYIDPCTEPPHYINWHHTWSVYGSEMDPKRMPLCVPKRTTLIVLGSPKCLWHKNAFILPWKSQMTHLTAI